jgi:hypothetical protein
MATKGRGPNGAPRDLLARRLLGLERGQAVTNQRLGHVEALVDVTNERLAGVERLAAVLVDELRGLRRDLGEALRGTAAVEDLRRRVEILEGRAQG